MSELPVGVSHLLVADDALIPGRWGVHITVCGQEIRRPSAEHDDTDPKFCPECVREAARYSAEAEDRASGAADQMATR